VIEPIGTDGGELFYVLRLGLQEPSAFISTLTPGKKTLSKYPSGSLGIPRSRREDENERLRCKQTIDIGRDTHAVEGGIIIVDSVLSAQNRIEALDVEIAIVDLVAARTQVSTTRLCKAATKLASNGWA